MYVCLYVCMYVCIPDGDCPLLDGFEVHSKFALNEKDD